MEVINSHFSSGFDAGRNSAMDECMCEIEQLRARVLELEEAAQDVQTLSAECFTLHERIANLEKERDAAMEEVEATRCDLNMVLRESARLREENTAAQLVIQRMREALDIAAKHVRPTVSHEFYCYLLNASELQPSTKALDAYVAEAVKAEREACAKVCDEYDEHIEAMRDGDYQAELAGRQMGAARCAAAIRARPNVTLEELL